MVEDYENLYCKYVDRPHFLQRAEWIKDYHDGMAGNVLEVGSSYGFFIKCMNQLGLEGHVFGLEPDAYPFSKVGEVGVSSYVYNVTVQEHNWDLTPNLDLIVSWNVLDCMPDEAAAESVIAVLNTKTPYQIHIICTDEIDNENRLTYIDAGFYMKPTSYWKSLLTLDDTVLVEYDTRRVWVRRNGTWVQETGWNIPLSWGLVSD